MDDEAGAAYRAAREALGLSVPELAERAQVDASTIRRVEAGAFQPRARTRRALRQALGMDGAAPGRSQEDTAALSRLVSTWYALSPARRALVQALAEALAGFDRPDEAGSAMAG